MTFAAMEFHQYMLVGSDNWEISAKVEDQILLLPPFDR